MISPLSIHIIGLGSLGSHLTECIAKQHPVALLHLWDGDSVERKNSRNQCYRPEHEGVKKAEALVSLVREWGGSAVPHPEMIDGYRPLCGIVFLAPDTMHARKIVCETCIWGMKSVALLVEIRTDARHSIIHVVDPRNERHREKWNQYWFPDAEAHNEGGCSGADPIMIATTKAAAGIASMQLWRFLRLVDGGGGDVLDNQIRLSMNPPGIACYKW